MKLLIGVLALAAFAFAEPEADPAYLYVDIMVDLGLIGATDMDFPGPMLVPHLDMDTVFPEVSPTLTVSTNVKLTPKSLSAVLQHLPPSLLTLTTHSSTMVWPHP